jgi:hypothetical protein
MGGATPHRAVRLKRCWQPAFNWRLFVNSTDLGGRAKVAMSTGTLDGTVHLNTLRYDAG